MKKKTSQLIGGILLCGILAINMLVTPKISFAVKENVLKGIEFLKDDTPYKYDLNGDDKVDEIKCKYGNENGRETLKIYINNKLCLTKESEIDGFDVQLCNLDKNDNYLDIFICENAPNDCKLNGFFTRYNGEALDSKVAFNPKDILNKDMDTGIYEIVKLDGNGTFYIRNYTIYCDAIGSFHSYVPFRLKDNAITAVPVNTYQLHEYTKANKYKASKDFPAYENAGSKKVAYTVKKGNNVTFDKLYISESGKAYFRMINTNGKMGWIRSDQKGLFTNAFMAG